MEKESKMLYQPRLGHYSKFMVILWTLSLVANSFAESTAENSNADIDATNSGQLALQVDHSLDDGYTFSTRGNLLIHSLRSGSASMDTSGGDGDESFVSQEQKESLRKLCDRDGLYLLRLIGQDGSIHRTATHACNLVNSGIIKGHFSRCFKPKCGVTLYKLKLLTFLFLKDCQKFS